MPSWQTHTPWPERGARRRAGPGTSCVGFVSLVCSGIRGLGSLAVHETYTSPFRPGVRCTGKREVISRGLQLVQVGSSLSADGMQPGLHAFNVPESALNWRIQANALIDLFRSICVFGKLPYNRLSGNLV